MTTSLPQPADPATPGGAIGRGSVRIRVNGRERTISIEADRFLVEVLRDDLGLTGTKLGCEVGVCGLCAVIVDGQLTSACLTLASTLDGAEIETVEGLGGSDGAPSEVQAAFVREGGFQCGICTPGQVVSATALLRELPRPTDREISDWMMGALCRCTGYEGIRAAIRAAAASGPPR